MNIAKRNQYEETMTLNGFDTLSGYVPGKISENEMQNGVKANINQCNYKVAREKTYLLINPNKQGKQEKLITGYSEFYEKMKFIMESIGADLDDLDVIRADFCFNSTNPKSYGIYQKLHRLILSCLAMAYRYNNCYLSCDLFSFDRLSIAIKKDDSEAENYNKHLERGGKDESANRLELRSKRINGTSIEPVYSDASIQYQFMTKWFERLDKASECFNDVQDRVNDSLENLYKEDLQKPPKERSYLSLNAFLLQYKESLYTRKQMINLLSRFEEVRNPIKRADRFKENHKIEYFSRKDLEYIIKVLKKKTQEYFNC